MVWRALVQGSGWGDFGLIQRPFPALTALGFPTAEVGEDGALCQPGVIFAAENPSSH